MNDKLKQVAREVQAEADARVTAGKVICDICDKDYTDLETSGGVFVHLEIGVMIEGIGTVIDTAPCAICPECINDEDCPALGSIIARCPPNQSFSEFVIKLRETMGFGKQETKQC